MKDGQALGADALGADGEAAGSPLPVRKAGSLQDTWVYLVYTEPQS